MWDESNTEGRWPAEAAWGWAGLAWGSARTGLRLAVLGSKKAGSTRAPNAWMLRCEGSLSLGRGQRWHRGACRLRYYTPWKARWQNTRRRMCSRTPSPRILIGLLVVCGAPMVASPSGLRLETLP